MEDDTAKLVDDIKEKIGKTNQQWADVIYDYFTANEFNVLFMFQSELNNKSECYLLDYLQLQFKLSKRIRAYQLDWIYNELYEIVFGYKPQIEEVKDEDMSDLDDEEKAELILEQRLKDEKLVSTLPSDLKWNTITNYEMSKYSTFINKHFPRLHQSLHYGDCGKSLSKILTMGYRHKIDLLSLIIDIYNEYRISIFIQSNKTKFIQFKEFINKHSMYFKNLKDQKTKNMYISGISYYIRKFQHILLFNPLNKINDKYEYFVKYTFALTQCLNKLRPLFINGTGIYYSIYFK